MTSPARPPTRTEHDFDTMHRSSMLHSSPHGHTPLRNVESGGSRVLCRDAQVEDVIGTGRCGMRDNQRLRTFCAGTRQPRIADWLKTGCQRLNLVGGRWLEVGASGFMWRCRCRSRAGTEVTWHLGRLALQGTRFPLHDTFTPHKHQLIISLYFYPSHFD
jgi:hypothetical protein